MIFPLRDENPTDKKPILTVALIAINLVIFLYGKFAGVSGQLVDLYGMVPNAIASGKELHTLFSSMFLHGGLFHVIGNIWFLWIFGDNIEDLFGRSKFLLIYFGAGILASLAHVAFNPSSTIPTIGASGAIAGILGAYIVKYPNANVDTLIFIFLFITVVKVPSYIFLGVWIGIQMLSASLATVAGTSVQVAYWAHIGGFFAGSLAALLLKGKT